MSKYKEPATKRVFVDGRSVTMRTSKFDRLHGQAAEEAQTIADLPADFYAGIAERNAQVEAMFAPRDSQ